MPLSNLYSLMKDRLWRSYNLACSHLKCYSDIYRVLWNGKITVMKTIVSNSAVRLFLWLMQSFKALMERWTKIYIFWIIIASKTMAVISDNFIKFDHNVSGYFWIGSLYYCQWHDTVFFLSILFLKYMILSWNHNEHKIMKFLKR